MSNGGSGKSRRKPESIPLDFSGRTKYSRSSKSKKKVEENPKPVSGLTVLGLGLILFVILMQPSTVGAVICFIPLMILFALKDILNIPTKFFIGLLVLIGVTVAFTFIRSMRGMGMY